MPRLEAMHAARPRPLAVPRPEPEQMLREALTTWGGQEDLWIFGYASLIWRPDFEFAESRPASVHGWHRALRMWSRVNRGTPEVPGLVFALLSGGSCRGVVYRVPLGVAPQVLARMWLREMVNSVYDPRWLPCRTSAGTVRALAFTLSRRSPSYTGPMSAAAYRAIFESAKGRYGSTLDYVVETGRTLADRGMLDRTLHRLIRDHRAAEAARALALRTGKDPARSPAGAGQADPAS